MTNLGRLFYLLLVISILWGCIKKEPVSTPVDDSQLERANQYTSNAKKLAKAALYRGSIFFYEKAIGLYTRNKDWSKAIGSYIQISENFQKLENYDEARKNLSKALELTSKNPEYQYLELAKSFQKIGFKYLSKGQYDRAIEMYSKALIIRIQKLGKHHVDVARTYNSISLALFNKGETQKAIENYKKSLSIKLRQFLGINFDIKKKYRLMEGDEVKKDGYSRARNYINQSLSVYQNTFGSDNPLFAAIYENIGILYAFEGEYDKALEYLNESFAIRLKLYGDHNLGVASNYHNIGICLRLKGDFDEALRFLNTALEIKQQAMDEFNPDIGDIYYQMGKIHAKLNYPSKALALYQKALLQISQDSPNKILNKNPLVEGIYSKDRLLKILTAKAQALKMRYLQDPAQIKDLEYSYNTYLLVSELIVRIRNSYKSESYKLFFGEKSHDIYDEAIQTALLLYEISNNSLYKKTAFSLSEQSKAAALEEALAESKALKFSGIPDELLEKENSLKNKLRQHETMLEKAYHETQIPSTKTIKEMEDKYFSLRSEYQDLIEYFERNYENYYNLKYNQKTIEALDLQQSLDQDSAFVEYFVGKKKLNIFVITRNRLEVMSKTLDESFDDTINSYYLSIKKIDEDRFFESSIKLYDLLIAPIWEYLTNKKKLVVIPHGKLYYIPFEALITEDNLEQNLSKINFLIKRFDFSYHYSAKLWSAINDSKIINSDKSFIGFAPIFESRTAKGNPTKVIPENTKDQAGKLRDVIINGIHFPTLPGTETEVKSIIELFKKESKPALGYFYQEASEEQFKSQEMKQYSIIHLATHSLKEEDIPILSGLIFTQEIPASSQEDGILYAGESYNLNLDAELIVLSSCETGIGKLVKGEGMIALNRGFLYSGVRNTIFSLWKVEDKSTSRLMIELYQNILQGKSYATALKQAKLSLINDPFTAFPKYWSGFILVGE
jgi:CHAT domain-containing protein/Tfp pilus assembly protein PilF